MRTAERTANRGLFACTLAFCLALLLVAPLAAQDWEIISDDDWCQKNRGRSKYCEIREITLPAWRDIDTESTNGSIRVEGWDRDEIKITAKVQVWGGSKKKTREIAEEIEIHASEDGIYAEGPKRMRGIRSLFNKGGWSVSYRIRAPYDSELAARSTNGALHIRAISGGVDFHTVNGGVTLSEIGGNVQGGTTNGGIRVELDRHNWNGDHVDVKTTNGGIDIALPDKFSADVDIKTTNGGIRVAHPVDIEQKSRRRLRGTIGNGGVKLRARTTNGGVRVSRQSA